MKKVYAAAIFIIFMNFIFSDALQAVEHSGHNLLIFGDSAASLGRGGTGVASYGSDIFYMNPAAVAASERIELGLQFGTLDFSYRSPALSFALPSSYGVIGAAFRMMDIPSDTLDIEKGYMLSIGGAKDFTKRILLGASLNIFTGSDPYDTLYYYGLSIGSIYRIDYNRKFKKGFQINNPLVGLSVSAGIPGGENDELADFNQVTIGYSFIFYSGDKFNISFFNDISAVHSYEDFPAKFGFESVILDRYIARAGFTAPHSYEYGAITAGAGYKFKTEDFEGDINYALVHYDGMDFTHNLGVNIKYGELDRTPPLVEMESTEEYISPNYDGKQDFMFFRPRVTDDSRLAGWKLQIIDEKEVVVREFRVSDREMEDSLTLKNFFSRIWQKKETTVVPESILWDGLDKYHQQVPDGKYSYSFTAWDERDNISAAKTGIIYVDNTSPAVSLTAEVLFSPNGDGQKDKLEIKLQVDTAADDEWKGYFNNSRGEPVRSYKWRGADIPRSLFWDGKDDSGRDVPEGLYSFSILSSDKAGNSVSLTRKDITLTRKYEVADITASLEYFSYKINKDINFFLNLSDTAGLKEWKVSIADDDGDMVREIKGGSEILKIVQWDVMDAGGKRLDDGKYYFKLSTKFESGNIPESYQKELIIDSSPPSVSVSYSPDLFSPDEDGENDILTIYPRVSDNTGIKSWNLVIYAPSGAPFKTYSGQGNPAGEIKWDGIGKDRDLVESAADYFLELSAVDLTGNSAKTERARLPIDVLVVVTERGLKIRISNIEFAFDRAELRGRAFTILDRVVEILEKYRNYNVLVEGHTDDIGKEEYNLKLSEARAKTVTDYLIAEGIDSGRLQFRGMGETAPFLPNTGDDNRRRNRRVEFLLIKGSFEKGDL